MNEKDVISTLIRSDISIVEDAIAIQRQAEEAAGMDEESDTLSPRVLHGSKTLSCSLHQLALAHSTDAAFNNIRRKLAVALEKKLNVTRVNLHESAIVCD